MTPPESVLLSFSLVTNYFLESLFFSQAGRMFRLNGGKFRAGRQSVGHGGT